MKRGEKGTISTGELAELVAWDLDLWERVSVFLGDDWDIQQRLVEYTLPQHCTRLDTETSYAWTD